MPGAPFLVGDRVTLRTIEEEDLPFLQRNVNDPAIRRHLAISRPKNEAQERKFLQTAVESDESVQLLACRDDEPIGTLGLDPIDLESGSAEIGLWLDPAYHGEGYGTEASGLLVSYAFRELRLHRVVARVLASNNASARLWEKLGFEAEGRHREAAFVDGGYVDVVYYGVLADEWDPERR